MSDPNMPPPPPPSAPPPPGQGWQSQPQQPGPPPPMGGGMPSWTSNITARGTVAGPAGLALADMIDRIIAWIIDSIIIAVIGFVVTTITTSILGDTYLGGIFGSTFRTASFLSAILAVVLMLAATGAYFILMWTRMGGATVGQKVMKLSVRDAASGGPISQNQAIYRWAFLGAPLAIYWGVWGHFLFWIAAIAFLAWEIYLLYTTANSPTRQGFHDQYVKTVVAKVM